MLVAGKLRAPVPPPRLVARPRVEGLIAGLIEHYAVVFVTATAGAGKTTAVGQATLLVHRPLAWVTAGDGDVAPGRLLEYLAAAISAHVSGVEGLARSALAAGISHDDVAALVVEAVGDQPLLLVIDELERVVQSAQAVAVLCALVRYLPEGLRVVLISRCELPLDIASLRFSGRAAIVDERELAFTTEEASQALRLVGAAETDAKAVLEITGGWVAGVMFEAWRADGRGAEPSREAPDPLHGYLARNILEQLPAPERELLLVTSVMSTVTAERAEALGISGAAARLTSLRSRHLPATWGSDPASMRCHTRLREYLRDELARSDAERYARAWRDLGRLWVREGYAEEAVRAFLAAGALEEGAAAAESCIVSIVERRDFDLARRWLHAFAGIRSPASLEFVTAELLIATWTDTCADGVAIGDRLLELGKREELARLSSRVAALLAVSYSGRGRHTDARAVLATATPSVETDAAYYLLTVQDDEPLDAEPPVPALTGGPLDVVILRSMYHRGLIARVAEEAPPVSERAIEPWRVLSMWAMGQTARAVEHYQRAPDRGPMWMAGVELMLDLDRADDAQALITAAQASLHARRDTRLRHRASILEAKLALRFRRDTATAHAALARVLGDQVGAGLASVREHAETWLGLASLIGQDDAEAAAVLRRTVASMTSCGRRLLLPVAAVYLAEAEWRLGDEEAADRAADIALEAARFQGSDHLLLGALRDFPSVAWRRVEAEARADSAWHRLARVMRSPRGVAVRHVSTPVPAMVEVIEFGGSGLMIEGSAVRPRLTKGHTLLALLAACPGTEAARKTAVGALFESGSDASTVSYLRLAVRSARETLPDGAELTLDRQVIRFSPPQALTSESVRFQSLVADAERLAGAERLGTLSTALDLYRRGSYLGADSSPWVAERRRELEDLAEEALFDAAATAHELAEYAEAERLVREALQHNRFREAAWRLAMRIAAATGDQDGVVAAFRACERALGEMRAVPSSATANLLVELRR